MGYTEDKVQVMLEDYRRLWRKFEREERQKRVAKANSKQFLKEVEGYAGVQWYGKMS